MDGTIKITAILKEPDGVWADEMFIPNLPEEPQATRALLVAAWQRLRGEGLIKFISNREMETIPMQRVKNINIVFEPKSISLDTDVSSAAAASKAIKKSDAALRNGPHIVR